MIAIDELDPALGIPLALVATLVLVVVELRARRAR